MGIIENILVRNDKRGIVSKISNYLPGDYLSKIAEKLLNNKGALIIATGFLINHKQETDGPIGALFLGKSLNYLGYDVVFVSNNECIRILKEIVDFNAKFIDYPICDYNESLNYSNELINNIKPSCMISIECRGAGESGRYLTSKGVDISLDTPCVDTLFQIAYKKNIYTLGIGDGGNEIGFGNIESFLLEEICIEPSRIKTTDLIVSSISNWGAYGLIYELSLIIGKNLLPGVEEEYKAIENLVNAGGIDGMLEKNTPTVDGFTVDKNSNCLIELHEEYLNNS
ncbi:MAG TPA: DUF4392 domain-containing protein [Victivallales bacterium]|nr:DUF4392 domain-containing protein [Victivallales bacterium]